MMLKKRKKLKHKKGGKKIERLLEQDEVEPIIED